MSRSQDGRGGLNQHSGWQGRVMGTCGEVGRFNNACSIKTCSKGPILGSLHCAESPQWEPSEPQSRGRIA